MDARPSVNLHTEDDAARLLDEVGFLPLSRNPFGILSLEEATAAQSWHMGEATDPWIWKDHLALTKRGAYARIMNKRLTLVSPGWYPVFLSAYRSPVPPKERYADGLLSHFALELFQCLQDELPQGTHTLKERLGVDKKTESAFEGALAELQGTFDITVSGTTRKVGKNGEPYGWPVTAYTTVDQWAPPEWFALAQQIGRDEAIERIKEQVQKLAPHLSEKDVKKFMGVRELR